MTGRIRTLVGTLALTSPLFATGCVIDVNGDDTAGDSGTGDPGGTGSGDTDSADSADSADSSDTGELPPSTHGPEHCGTIADTQIWAADLNPHVVTCDVQIEGGSVTVGPGVEIQVVDDAAIHVSEQGGGGELVVLGEASAPVDIHGRDGTGPGVWRGLGVFTGAEHVALHHVRVADAGGFNATANIMVERTEITADHVRVEAAEDLGWFFREGGGLTADSTALTVSGSTGYPVRVDPGQAHTLPAGDSDYSGNAQDAIAVESSGTDWDRITEAVAWEDLGVPYDAIDSLVLAGSASDPAVLTLGAGVTVRFATQSSITAGANGGAAGLVTAGTESQPVVLTALGSATRGSWTGVRIEASVGDGMVDLTGTTIEYGGGFNGVACLSADGPGIRVDAVTLRGCEDAGFHFIGGAHFDATSADLQVLDSAVAGEIQAPMAHSVGLQGASYTGNDADEIRVFAPGAERIDTSVTWAALGVPYRMMHTLRVEGTAQQPAVLRVLPGAVLLFDTQSHLDVSPTGGAAGLLAQGTEQAPIYFGPAGSNVPGGWPGIRISSGAAAPDLALDWVDIAWGGGFNSEANLRIEDASPTISNATIRSSACWGIEIWGDSDPVLQSITYADNDCGDVGP